MWLLPRFRAVGNDMWASRPLGSREQALGEVNDGESGQQGKNQTDSQRGYLTV